jgi:hypothetical protein
MSTRLSCTHRRPIEPDARTYTDLALTPVRDDDDVTLDLLTKTTGARAAVAHVNKVNELIGAPRPHSTAE